MSNDTDLDKLKLSQLINYFKGPNLGEEYDYYDRLAGLIRDQGQPGNKFLIDTFRAIADDGLNSDEEHLRALIWSLSIVVNNSRNEFEPLDSQEQEFVCQQLMAYLNNYSDLILIASINGLGNYSDNRPREQILKYANHVSEYVRSSVVSYISKVDRKLAIPFLLQALTDHSYVVRDTVIDELFTFHDPRLIPHIRPLLKDPNPMVVESAHQVIKALEDQANYLSDI